VKRAWLRGASALLDPLPKHSCDRVCSAKKGPERSSIKKRMHRLVDVAFFLLLVQKKYVLCSPAALRHQALSGKSWREASCDTGTDRLRDCSPDVPGAGAISLVLWTANELVRGLSKQSACCCGRNSWDALCAALPEQNPLGSAPMSVSFAVHGYERAGIAALLC